MAPRIRQCVLANQSSGYTILQHLGYTMPCDSSHYPLLYISFTTCMDTYVVALTDLIYRVYIHFYDTAIW